MEQPVQHGCHHDGHRRQKGNPAVKCIKGRKKLDAGRRLFRAGGWAHARQYHGGIVEAVEEAYVLADAAIASGAQYEGKNNERCARQRMLEQPPPEHGRGGEGLFLMFVGHEDGFILGKLTAISPKHLPGNHGLTASKAVLWQQPIAGNSWPLFQFWLDEFPAYKHIHHVKGDTCQKNAF